MKWIASQPSVPAAAGSKPPAQLLHFVAARRVLPAASADCRSAPAATPAIPPPVRLVRSSKIDEDVGEGERTIGSLRDQVAAAPTETLAKSATVEDKPITRAEPARREADARSLRRRDREIHLAHRLDDMSYAATAKATGLSMAQVERAMSRAVIGINRHLRGAPPRRWWWPF